MLDVLALERRGLGIDLLQMLRIVVELERIGRSDERPIHEMGLHHAAKLAPEAQASFGERLAMPAAFGLLGERIEALGDIGGSAPAPACRPSAPSDERARDRRLLDDEARVARYAGL